MRTKLKLADRNRGRAKGFLDAVYAKSNRPGEAPDVQVGGIFRCPHTGPVLETAKVLAVRSDSYGIPHVTYQVRIRRANHDVRDGPRMLALKSFVKRYTEHYTEHVYY